MSRYAAYGSPEFNELCRKKRGGVSEDKPTTPEPTKEAPKVKYTPAPPVPDKKPRKAHPTVSSGLLDINYITSEKPPKKVVIQFLKERAEQMMVDSDDDIE